VEIAETVEQIGQREVKRAQSQHRCNVRGVHHKGIVRDGKHCGNRVCGEDDVCDLDSQDHWQQRALGRLEPSNPFRNGSFGRAATRQAPGCVEKKKTEDPCDPVEPF
jgi:hypothetical protein